MNFGELVLRGKEDFFLGMNFGDFGLRIFRRSGLEVIIFSGIFLLLLLLVCCLFVWILLLFIFIG